MGKDFRGLNNLEEILEKARKLDENALAWLVKEFYPVMFRYFFYRTKTREDAEDLTSEVFVRVVGSIRNQQGNFIAWLFRIAKNLLIDHYRKSGRTKEISLEEVGDPASSPAKDKRETPHPEEIKKILDSLTDEQREVITLKFIEGYTNEEVANVLGKSVGAVKLLQFRALSKLKDTLSEEII